MSDSALRTARVPGAAILVGGGVALAGYLLLVHLLIVRRALPLVLLAVVAAPWLVAIGSMLLKPGPDRRATTRRRALAAALIAIVAFAAWRFGDRLASHADFVVYLENLVFVLALASTFAITVRPGREALITRLARTARNGDMPPAIVRYTRMLTLVWAGFFAAVAALSSALYFSQSLDAWSAFVNLALWPLVAALFAGEYAVRLRVLRGYRHGTMMTGVRAFRDRAAADGPEVRGGSS